MGFISYQTLNSLDETSFIAGSDFTLEYHVFEKDNVTPQDLGGATITWVLSPYGVSDDNVLQKIGTITDTNVFQIKLIGTDTMNLSGKFIQQPIIVDFSGNTFRPAQGVILILPATPTI